MAALPLKADGQVIVVGDRIDSSKW
jgi:hypothetical protein